VNKGEYAYADKDDYDDGDGDDAGNWTATS